MSASDCRAPAHRAWSAHTFPVVLGALALLMAWLASRMPAETFAVGDSGVKLIAARNAIANPRTPLEIPLPVVGDETLTAVDPFFVVHGDHSHATTGPLLPIVTAPFFRLAGPRGLYVLPGVGFLVWLACWAGIGRHLDAERSAPSIALVAALATPVFFYGLEFWDHAPALGAAAAGTWFLTATPGSSRHAAMRASLASGLLFGVATLFRPELGCYAAVAAVAVPALLGRRSLETAVLGAAGWTIAMAPFLAYNWTHFGSPLGVHVGANLGLLTDDWWRSRLAIAGRWFLLPSTINAYRVALALPVLLVLSIATGYRQRRLLVVLAGATALLILLTAPNDGGSQWGPRYLLPMYGPLAVLGADGLRRLSGRGRLASVLVAVLMVLAAAGQRTAYRELRSAKRGYDRILSLVRAEVPAGGIVVSDLWWLDQVAASAADRVLLFTADHAREEAVRAAVVRNRIGSVYVVRSREESRLDDRAWQPPCFREVRRRELAVRGLTLAAYRVECAP